jgi:hypothetical protein
LIHAVDRRVVMNVLGHATLRITPGTRQNVVPDLGRSAADRTEKPLSKG